MHLYITLHVVSLTLSNTCNLTPRIGDLEKPAIAQPLNKFPKFMEPEYLLCVY
jgi:hypothetical protein